MNTIETTPRIEKKFDEDRVGKERVSSPPRPLNTLRPTKSAPVSSIPRESLLVRSPTSLLTSTVDHGLMEMFVDDGTNGNIDDTVRLLRFSTAASTIDGLFHSPRRNTQGSNTFGTGKPTHVSPAPAKPANPSSQASDKTPVSSCTQQRIAEKPVHMDGNSQGPKKAREATETVISASEGGPSMIKRQPDILETEPVTPPKGEGNKLGEETDSSETTGPAKKSSSEHTTSGSFGKNQGREEKAPADSAQNLQLKRISTRAVKNPPTPAFDSHFRSTEEQTDGRRSNNVLPVFARKSLPALGTETERPPELVERKNRSDEGKIEGVNDAEAVESPKVDPSDGRVSPKSSERPKILNLFKRRSTVERQIPVDAQSGSGRNTPCSNDQNEPATKRGPRKLRMLVKKLSSGFRERADSERKTAITPSGIAPASTVPGAAVPQADKVHAGTPDSCERPACEGQRSDLPAQQPASSGGSRNVILEQATQSISNEHVHFTKGDRQLLQRLLKGFSSGSKDRTSESKVEGHGELRQEAPAKGVFFAKLFRRKSTNAEEREGETGNASCPEEGVTGDTPAFSAPPESQTRWSQLSRKVTRFLGMLVH